MRTAQRRSACKAAPDDGATAVEYALMATFIAVAIAVAVGTLGTALAGLFTSVLAGF